MAINWHLYFSRSWTTFVLGSCFVHRHVWLCARGEPMPIHLDVSTSLFTS